MVDFIEFFRLFDFSTWGEGLNGPFYLIFATFRLFHLGGGSNWAILFKFPHFLTFQPGGDGLNGQSYRIFSTFRLFNPGNCG